MLRKLATLLVLGLAVGTPAAQCQSNPGVKGAVKIDASPSNVWKAVHDERAKDSDLAYSKVIQQKGNRVLLEQKFNALPVIGEATCLMVQEETPEKRIDYKMVKSDKFKEMSGSWTLETQADGGVKLELYSVLDTGLPYSQGVINALLQDKINKRLSRVKAAAESLAQGQSNPF